MNSKDLNRLARDPLALMKYQTTGKLTRNEAPTSPLITLIMSLHPRERIRILNVQIHPDLGYRSTLRFQNAGQALNWLSPPNPSAHIPSESYKLGQFREALSIEDLARHATVPDDILEAWNRRQRRPASPGSSEMTDPAP